MCIDVNRLGLTGYQAGDWLREHYGVHVELADYRRVMALTTYADTHATARRFIDAMAALSEAHTGRTDQSIDDAPPFCELRTETVMLPRDAYLGATEMVEWRKASGRISAEMICPYPPGIPVIAPGEVLTDAIMDYLEQQAAKGVMVEGAADESLAEFRVVAR